MNDKLIRRAAAVYHRWMLEQESDEKETVGWSISRDLTGVLAKTEEMLRWMRVYHKITSPSESSKRLVIKDAYQSIVNEMLPELFLDTNTYMAKVSKYLDILSSNNPENKTVITPSFRSIIEEIDVINSAWPETTFRDGKLIVLIKNVILSDGDEEVSLGDFRIILDLTSPSHDDSLDIKSVDCVKSEDGYYHPHVNDEGLCAGSGVNGGKERMCYALCQGRLEDYFRIIEAILRTYNEASPYTELSNWYNPDHEGEFYCNHCDEFRPDDECCYCTGCENEYCYQCNVGGGTCQECEEWKCDDCTVICEDCGEIVCGTCMLRCSNCLVISCSSCLEECDNCGSSNCSSCKESCSGCQTNMCCGCGTECDCCGAPCCEECLDKKCTECLGTICGECQNTCDSCDKTLCNECSTNECEDCGVTMCKSCVEKHNCMLEGIVE